MWIFREWNMRGIAFKQRGELALFGFVILNLAQDPNHSKFLVNKEPDGEASHLMIDLGVYTKNRNFRIFNSTKLGANRPLVVAPTNAFNYHVPHHLLQLAQLTTQQDERDLFQCSLITHNIHHPIIAERNKVLKFEKNVMKLLEYAPVMVTTPKTKSPHKTPPKSTARPSSEPSPFAFVDTFMDKVRTNSWMIESQSPKTN